MANQAEIKIKADNNDLKGNYANAMQVVHTREEFVIDFFLTSPPEGMLVSRVITSPRHLKRIAATLTENLGKYEEKFGKIEELNIDEPKVGFQV
ncbi:MAG: DUF3467 domain-containing protein [bacterium]